jgi:antirestriction protein ArdC
MRDVYQEVTDQIVAAIEAGAGSWEMPWHCKAGGLPVNAARGYRYNGINVFTLWCAQDRNGFGSAEWATFKQWQSIGAQVRKGERGSTSIFFKPLEIDDASAAGGKKTIPIAREAVVFNADQVDGYQADADLPLFHAADRIAHADEFVRRTGAVIHHGGGRAYYRISTDEIQLPDFASFHAPEGYYGTALHELTHWTRHESRLAREFGRERWGDEGYATEELVAELGAAMVCASLGIQSRLREDHAAYIANWLKVLKNDKRAIFTAAAHAGRAADFLHGLQTAHAAVPELIAA